MAPNDPVPLKDEVTSALQQTYAPPSSLARPTQTKKPTQKLLESIAGQPSTKKSNPNKHQTNIVSLSLDPLQTFQEALSRSYSPQWQAAIQAKFESLDKN